MGSRAPEGNCSQQEQQENQPRLHPYSALILGVYELHPIFRARSLRLEGGREAGHAEGKGRAGMLSLSSGPAAARPGCAAKPGAALPSSAAAPDCSIARKPGLMAWMELRELQRGLGLGLVFFFSTLIRIDILCSA